MSATYYPFPRSPHLLFGYLRDPVRDIEDMFDPAAPPVALLLAGRKPIAARRVGRTVRASVGAEGKSRREVS